MLNRKSIKSTFSVLIVMGALSAIAGILEECVDLPPGHRPSNTCGKDQYTGLCKGGCVTVDSIGGKTCQTSSWPYCGWTKSIETFTTYQGFCDSNDDCKCHLPTMGTTSTDYNPC